MWWSARPLILGLGLCAAACTGTSGDELGHASPPSGQPGTGGLTDTEQATCSAIFACNEARGNECVKWFVNVDADHECHERIQSAECSEHEGAEPNYFEECFPRCDERSAECTADGTLIQCLPEIDDELRQVGTACERVCRAYGRVYTGICGERYGSLSSTTGLATCWCESA